MIEQEVRDMLQSKVRNAPALDEPPAKVLRRARGRRALNTAGVAAGLAVVVVGSLIGVRSLGTTPVEPIVPLPGGVIPWVDPTGTPATQAPACTAEDLVLSAAPVTRGRLSFVPSHADVRCRLDLGIAIRIREATGRDVPLRIDPGDGPRDDMLIANTSRTTDISLNFTHGCLPSGSLRFDVTLPQKGGTLSTTTSDEPMACYGSGEELRATLAFGSGSLRAAGNLADLRVQIQRLPQSIARGQVLRYVVQVSNPTNGLIRFDTCPGFAQTLVDVRKSQPGFSVLNQLNCRAIPDAIPGHRSILFAMQYEVPRESVLGQSHFRWELAVDGTISERVSDAATILITE